MPAVTDYWRKTGWETTPKEGAGPSIGPETSRTVRGPLALVRQSIRHYPKLFRPALAKLENVDRTLLSDLVNRIPACWMTSLARAFAIALMSHNLQRLGELVR